MEKTTEKKKSVNTTNFVQVTHHVDPDTLNLKLITFRVPNGEVKTIPQAQWNGKKEFIRAEIERQNAEDVKLKDAKEKAKQKKLEKEKKEKEEAENRKQEAKLSKKEKNEKEEKQKFEEQNKGVNFEDIEKVDQLIESLKKQKGECRHIKPLIQEKIDKLSQLVEENKEKEEEKRQPTLFAI